jgi:diaminopropionate ammonia-lyase
MTPSKILLRARSASPQLQPISAARAMQVWSFHQTLPDYAATRLIQSDALARRLGVRTLSIKVEDQRFGLPAFKMLGASWAAFHAVCERLNLEPTNCTLDDLRRACQTVDLTLITATDGNHGRAVARMARWLGLKAHIYLPHNIAAPRVVAIQDEGAQTTVIDGSYDQAVALTAQLQDARTLVISDTAWDGYQRIPWWVIEGYTTMLQEAEAAMHTAALPSPDCVVIPVGVGALATAVVGYWGHKQMAFISVEPFAADCVRASLEHGQMVQVDGPHTSIMAGLNCGVPSPLALPWLTAYIDGAVALEDDLVRAAVYDLWHVCGIAAGESGAASLAGLYALLDTADAAQVRQHLRLTAHHHVLLLLTEGVTNPHLFDEIIHQA